MLIGLYLPEVPGRLDPLEPWRTALGPAFRLVSLYQAWGSVSRGFQSGALEEIHRRGLVPLITWEPWRLPAAGVDPVRQTPFTLQSILDGRHDAYIRAWAEACRAFGKRVLLRPMHEMNGDWYPWCGTVNDNLPNDFVPAWKHLHQIFRNAGAQNVRWLWSPYVSSHPDVAANQPEAYFPGDEYVDCVALDAYNWGTREPQFGWQSFADLLAPVYERLAQLSARPFLLAEVGSAEEGGSKAEWIWEMFGSLSRRFPRVQGLIWFNVQKERDWRIDSSTEARDAFVDAVRSRAIHPATSSLLG